MSTKRANRYVNTTVNVQRCQSWGFFLDQDLCSQRHEIGESCAFSKCSILVKVYIFFLRSVWWFRSTELHFGLSIIIIIYAALVGNYSSLDFHWCRTGVSGSPHLKIRIYFCKGRDSEEDRDGGNKLSATVAIWKKVFLISHIWVVSERGIAREFKKHVIAIL